MIRPTALLAILATLGLGCSTKYVGAPATPASIAAVEAKHQGAPIYVESLQPWGEARPGARLVRTTPELTIVVAEEHSPELSLPIERVRRLSVKDRGQGAMFGAGIGVLLAAALVTTVALTYTPCNPDLCSFDLGRAGTAELVGIIVGIPLIGLSTGVGALVGARTTYVFE